MATRKNTAPAEAPSASVIAEALELRRLIRSVLAGSPPPVSVEAEAGAEAPGRQIRAFLASVRPTRHVIYVERIAEANQRGRSLVERMAAAAVNDDVPALRLTAEEIADALSFLACSEPVDLKGWWSDTLDGPSWVCGYLHVLQALEKSLRDAGEQQKASTAASDAPELPEALRGYLREQQTRVAELLSLLERLDEDAEPMYTRIAVRQAEELEKALDETTLHKVMAGEAA